MQSKFRQLVPAAGWRTLLASLNGEKVSFSDVSFLTWGVTGGVLPLEIRDPATEMPSSIAALLVPGKSITDDVVKEIEKLVRSKHTERCQ